MPPLTKASPLTIACLCHRPSTRFYHPLSTPTALFPSFPAPTLAPPYPSGWIDIDKNGEAKWLSYAMATSSSSGPAPSGRKCCRSNQQSCHTQPRARNLAQAFLSGMSRNDIIAAFKPWFDSDMKFLPNLLLQRYDRRFHPNLRPEGEGSKAPLAPCPKIL